jgi:hypothetical protein
MNLDNNYGIEFLIICGVLLFIVGLSILAGAALHYLRLIF